MLGRVLAIDYGRKRTGLASCDPLGITVQPLDTLVGDPAANLPRIVELCREREVTRIVLGLPYNMDGTEGKIAAEVRRYGAALATRTGLPVEYTDERLTSWAGEQHLKAFKKKIRRNKALIDAMAAVEILRDWMASQGEGKR